MGLKCVRGQPSDEFTELSKKSKSNLPIPKKPVESHQDSVVQLDQEDDDNMKMASMAKMDSMTSFGHNDIAADDLDTFKSQSNNLSNQVYLPKVSQLRN